VDFTSHEVIRPALMAVATGTALFLEQHGRARGRPVEQGEVEPVVWSSWQHARGLRAADYLEVVNTMHALGRRVAALHERHDLILTPTLAEPPARLGRFTMDRADYLDYRLGPQGLWRYSPFCPLTNATGAPSISLPVAMSSTGLPIGAMLAAALGQDALLLRVAAQWEATRGPLPFPFLV
jgi:amidase/6-aminohexanoate-cyclic-dimer hydrolase